MAKKLWSMLLVIAMLMSAFAMTSVAEGSDLSGTITIGMQARPGTEIAWREVIKAYNAIHPNVNVVLDLKPAEGYAEWISTVTHSENPQVDIAEFDWGDYTSAKMICITGSNGKTTTTSLIFDMLRRAGLDVGLAGNIGNSLALQVAQEDHAYYVIELSSFQLDNCYDFRADIAILLNITPDT